MSNYRPISALKTPEAFRAYQQEHGIALPFDENPGGADSPLAQPIILGDRTIGNRLCALPMEGWDCEPDGRPSPYTARRWRNFGLSGAKLIWGGEAAAVVEAGKSNPRQMEINTQTAAAIADLRQLLVDAHIEAMGSAEGLYVGLQLTHSGRFSKPHDNTVLESRVAYRHPLLEGRYAFTATCAVLSDGEIDELVGKYVEAAVLSQQAGFDFVDVKLCHGYLGHELLSAFDRPGRYGGSFENRTRFLREIVAGIRRDAPGLGIGVRVSIVDMIPFRKNVEGIGEPEAWEGVYPYAFGGDGTGTGFDYTEPLQLLDLFAELGIRLVCLTLGSPYYNPHMQRPALFPPSDGYQPPEDPLVGVARHLRVAADLKRLRPTLIYVASGLTYLQEWFPGVAQAAVRAGHFDSAGLGRMMLSYPDICKDTLAGAPLQTKRICRTFSDCTSAPRRGLISGCYPLDPYYKGLPEAEMMKGARTGR